MFLGYRTDQFAKRLNRHNATMKIRYSIFFTKKILKAQLMEEETSLGSLTIS